MDRTQPRTCALFTRNHGALFDDRGETEAGNPRSRPSLLRCLESRVRPERPGCYDPGTKQGVMVRYYRPSTGGGECRGSPCVSSLRWGRFSSGLFGGVACMVVPSAGNSPNVCGRGTPSRKKHGVRTPLPERSIPGVNTSQGVVHARPRLCSSCSPARPSLARRSCCATAAEKCFLTWQSFACTPFPLGDGGQSHGPAGKSYHGCPARNLSRGRRRGDLDEQRVAAATGSLTV